MKIVPSVVVAVLLVSCSTSLHGQEKVAAKAEPAKEPLVSLAEAVHVKLDVAIATALKARAGIATGVELESRKVDGEAVPVFEVMICGKDDRVFEVFVNAVDGEVVANEPCKDEDDVQECRALLAGGAPRLALADVVKEACSLLRGKCIGAEFDGKEKAAKVLMLNRGSRLGARWSLTSGNLLEVAWIDSRKKGGEGDDAAEKGGEHGEGAKARKGEHEAEEGEEHEGDKDKKAGKRGKNETEEENEGEHGATGERSEGNKGRKKAKKGGDGPGVREIR